MNKIEFGDCREIMKGWKEAGVKVQSCITSPPYFGLRDYGVDGQIGREKSPKDYVAELVEVFDCVKDILADDGTLWLNLGDGYAANRTYQVPSTKGGAKHSPAQGFVGSAMRVPEGMKPKDLIGIPWMVAFALRDAGWYLRQDIIWNKPNVMPESVKDRCTKSHEYVFLLSKSPKYYFDSHAIREPATMKPQKRAVRAKYEAPGGGAHRQGTQYLREDVGLDSPDGLRNKRSVWDINTKPYRGAHFAVFPTALVDPCVLAGSRVGDTILDPFMGSGTTAEVALTHGRQYLGCELNRDYESLQQQRLLQIKEI